VTHTRLQEKQGLDARCAGRLQAARTQTAILSLKTVAERLDALLDTGNPQLPAGGHWRELDHTLAVSPEALYRELARPEDYI
jgi:hypothetical protein